MFIKQPLDEFLGFKYEKIDDTHLQIGLPVKELFVNSVGVIHGGILSTLADVAMSNLIPADEKGVQKAVTVDLNVTFLKPATGSYLTAKAQIEKNGKTLIHTTCFIYNDLNEQVVTAKGIFYRSN